MRIYILYELNLLHLNMYYANNNGTVKYITTMCYKTLAS